MERRNFLKLLGVTGAGAATACDQKIGPKMLIPYLVPPEQVTPGVATWYTSTCRECPGGCGVHVKTREGRVIKLEGNPDSPVNRGKLCARGQAAHQNLYDPDRLRGPQRLDGGEYVAVAWDEAVAAVARDLGAAAGEPGAVVLLTALQTGTRARFFEEWAAAHNAEWIMYEPFAHEAVLEAHRQVLGTAAIPSYDIAGAELVVSFGADFLGTWVSPVRFGIDWAAMHAFRGGNEERDRRRGLFVAVEPRMSMTASNADEWLAAAPGTEHLVALAMANVLGAGGAATDWTPARASGATGVPAATIERLARLFGERRSVALPGGIGAQHGQAAAAAAAVALLNQAGGAIGDTVRLSPGVNGGIEQCHRRMTDLVARMRNGAVRALLVHEANPAFALPPEIGFEAALSRVPLRVSLSSVFDETASHCHWLLPDHTPLESWGDWVPETGVVSIQQPAMRPLFDTRAAPDVLLQLHRAMVAAPAGGDGAAAGQTGAAGQAAAAGGQLGAAGQPSAPQAAAGARGLDAPGWYEYLRAAWSDRAPGAAAWAELLQTGGVWAGAAPAAGGAPATGAAEFGDAQPLDFGPAAFTGPQGDDTFVLHLFPHVAIYDGRGANRPWLQEMPEPASTVMWHTWIELHPDTAERLRVKNGDVVSIESPYGTLEAPAIVYPGIRPDTVAMPLGRGHARMGRFARGMGVNPVALLPGGLDPASGALSYQAVRVRLSKTGAWVPPLKGQGSDIQHDRGIAQATPLAAALGAAATNGHAAEGEHPTTEGSGAAAAGEERVKFHSEVPHHGEHLSVERAALDSARDSPYRWGMAISLDACTGCGACVIACQAENNIPFVGPERVAMSRQMQWLRIERFFEEKPGGGLETRHVPMLCQHCGAAPCEPVCPVYATYHNPDGLNVQVYNRCVGTRYCSNNCPYKVRYFNWFNYEWPEPLNLALNPDVTTREVGVMEKCTYCVQRINAAKIAVRDSSPDAVIPDGYFQTACQQTCPTEAIVFGNLKDPGSRAARLAGGGLQYSVLEVLNTRPANFYLKQVHERLEETRT